MKKIQWVMLTFWLLLLTLAANSYVLMKAYSWMIPVVIAAVVLVQLFAGLRYLSNIRLVICYHGMRLLSLFLLSIIVSSLCQIILAFYLLPANAWEFVYSLLVCIGVLSITFWNGMICIYGASVQLGIRYRAWGLFCGMIPGLNVVMLVKMLQVVDKEVRVEQAKAKRNELREKEKVCDTKYPILLVHGFFFRDSKRFNYWGRIPRELERNGAAIFYGEHQSAAAIADSAQELTDRVKEIVKKTGCEKVNIIAHSKGGLDCRYAMAHLDMTPYVASLTTVNTPHRGCLFAEYLLEKLPKRLQNRVCRSYNSLYKKLGDHKPDFMAAARDLTASGCKIFADMPMPEGVYCHSVGSVMEKARRGKFPMNLSYPLVKHFDGLNDGLVAESSFAWGQAYTLVTTKGKRGISHMDIIDMNRENIDDFDVREFYVWLVSRLKQMGL